MQRGLIVRMKIEVHLFSLFLQGYLKWCSWITQYMQNDTRLSEVLVRPGFLNKASSFANDGPTDRPTGLPLS